MLTIVNAYMMCGAAGAAGRGMSPGRQGGGQWCRRVGRRQRLAQRRCTALPEQPEHLLGRDRPFLAIRRAQVIRAIS